MSTQSSGIRLVSLNKSLIQYAQKMANEEIKMSSKSKADKAKHAKK